MSSFEYNFALYSYWRSSASWRVRLVLALKDIPFEYRTVNLLAGEHVRISVILDLSFFPSKFFFHQKKSDFAEVNPAGLIPALVVYDTSNKPITTITQSVAIVDFLDHYRPSTCKLMPDDPFLCARVLEIVNTIVCDTHPLQNPRVISTYPEEKRPERTKEVILAGLSTVEALLNKHNHEFDGEHCLGNTLTLADIVLIPQVYNAVR
jgi:glutathione S-transferase